MTDDGNDNFTKFLVAALIGVGLGLAGYFITKKMNEVSLLDIKDQLAKESPSVALKSFRYLLDEKRKDITQKFRKESNRSNQLAFIDCVLDKYYLAWQNNIFMKEDYDNFKIFGGIFEPVLYQYEDRRLRYLSLNYEFNLLYENKN